MPIDPDRLKQLIAARRFEDFGRRLPEASAADLAAVPTADLLTYLDSLSDVGRRTAPDSLLQELRRRRPTEVEPVLALAGWLLLVGFAADSGLVIDAALEAAEYKGRLAWQWILHLLGLGIPAEARAQLASVSARYLDPLDVEQAAAQIDLEEKKFDAAAARLEPIARRYPELLGVRVVIDRARTCGSIAARFAAAQQAPLGAPDYAVFAINLDEQAERFATLQRQFPTDRPALIRCPGVKGRYLPDVAAARLTSTSGGPLQKGTLGCFLAHVAAWERFRASVFDHGLFVEDDAKVAIGLPPSLAVLDLPSGYDLCFANYGLEPRAPPKAGFLHVVPVAAAVAKKPSAWNAPGGYGYFLSRNGVDKLLGRVARDGFSGDIDWRLLACSIARADYEALSPDSFAFAALRQHAAFIQTIAPITGYCLYPALLLPGRISSIRMADNIVR